MIGSTTNRAARRRTASRVRRGAVAGAAAAALALGVATAPQAGALTFEREVTWNPTYTSGTLAGLLNVVGNAFPGLDLPLGDTFGYTSGPPQSIKITVATEIIGIGLKLGLNLNLKNIPGDTNTLYNTIAALPQPACTTSNYASNCRYGVQLATSEAVLNLIDAYRAQIASVKGTTPGDLIPYTSVPGSTVERPTQTNQGLLFLQNPLRPNGGLAARFPDISTALGIDPVMPAAGKVLSPDRKTVLNTSTLDLTWAYDPVGDFPAVFNLTAMINSALAALPINLVGGLKDPPLQGDSLTNIGLNLAGVLQFPLNLPLLPVLAMTNGQAFYGTLVPNLLPILTPAVLPGTLINAGLNALNSPFLLGNPFVDAIAPALKILVNTGYTDVLSPSDLNTCATGCTGANPQSWAQLGYQAYDRTFGANAAPDDPANPRTPTPFGSVQPLTEEERAAVPGDVFNALLSGIQAQFAKPFWGILVPATPPQQVTPPAAVKSAATAAPAAPAPAAAVPQGNSVAVQEIPAAPVVSEPEAGPAPAEFDAADLDAVDIDTAGLDAALAQEAAAEAPAPAARAARAGDSDERRDGSARPSVSPGRGR